MITAVTRTGGHVVGTLVRAVGSGGGAYEFPVGNGGYAPVLLSFPGGGPSGDAEARTTPGDHPDLADSGLDAARSVNRWWHLASPPAVAGATFQWPDADRDTTADCNAFTAGRKVFHWATTNVTSRTCGDPSTLTIALPGSSLAASELAIGEPASDDPLGTFFAVAPCRLLDTRQPGQGPALSSGVERTLRLPLGCGIPGTARALALTVTAVTPNGDGDVAVYPVGAGPLPQVVHFVGGRTRAGNTVAPLADDGSGLAVLATIAGGGTVHLVLDVTGYFR